MRGNATIRTRFHEPDIEKLFTSVDDRDYERYCAVRGLNPCEFTRGECMAIAAGRDIPDAAFIFAGTGLPMIGCMFAQHTYAPTAVVVMESGIIGSRMLHLPISVADPRAAYRCTILGSMADAFGTIAMRGYCTLGILGAAECDKYGNLNSTTIGNPEGTQQTRLAGSGGANPIASFADFVIAMMVHERRRFPECCSYLTSSCGARGRASLREDRWSYGLYRGGRVVVLSTLGVLRTDETGDGELLLDALYPGVEEKEIYENTGWDLKKTASFHRMFAPTYEELKVLRYVVDPDRVYLGRYN